MTMWFCKITY